MNKLAVFPEPPLVAFGSGENKGPNRLLSLKLHDVLMPGRAKVRAPRADSLAALGSQLGIAAQR